MQGVTKKDSNSIVRALAQLDLTVEFIRDDWLDDNWGFYALCDLMMLVRLNS